MRSAVFSLLLFFGVLTLALGAAFLKRRNEPNDMLGGLVSAALGFGLAAVGLVFLIR